MLIKDIDFNEDLQTTEDAIAFFEIRKGSMIPYQPKDIIEAREKVLSGDLSVIRDIESLLN